MASCICAAIYTSTKIREYNSDTYLCVLLSGATQKNACSHIVGVTNCSDMYNVM